jgi:nitrogen fixation NifU-like protein
MYNELIVENFSSPGYSGEMESPDFALELGNPVCGDKLEIKARIEDGLLLNPCFQAWGCATSIATANIFCRYIDGKSIDEVRSTESGIVENMLGELDPSQHHCLEMLSELFSQTSQKH